jgi:hypothetical protein
MKRAREPSPPPPSEIVVNTDSSEWDMLIDDMKAKVREHCNPLSRFLLALTCKANLVHLNSSPHNGRHLMAAYANRDFLLKMQFFRDPRIYEKGMRKSLLRWAAKYGNRAYLYTARKCGIFYEKEEAIVISDAVKKQQWHVIDWLVTLEGRPAKRWPLVIAAYCKYGVFDRLKAAEALIPTDQFARCLGDASPMKFAKHGNLEALQWIKTRGNLFINWADHVLQAAVKYKQIPIVNWCLDELHVHLCHEFINGAVRNNDLEWVQWLRARGCPWSGSAYDHNLSPEMLLYLIENQCPVEGAYVTSTAVWVRKIIQVRDLLLLKRGE